MYAEPACPFLQTLQNHVRTKLPWEGVGICSQRAVLVSAAVQMIQALRKPWLTALLLEQPSLPDGECLTC